MALVAIGGIRGQASQTAVSQASYKIYRPLYYSY